MTEAWEAAKSNPDRLLNYPMLSWDYFKVEYWLSTQSFADCATVFVHSKVTGERLFKMNDIQVCSLNIFTLSSLCLPKTVPSLIQTR